MRDGHPAVRLSGQGLPGVAASRPSADAGTFFSDHPWIIPVDESEARMVRRLVGEMDSQGAVVVVEGKRDAAALRRLGYTGAVMQFHRYGGFAKFADVAATHRRLVVLLDYDREGRYMTYRLIRLLQRRTALDLSYRRRLARITGGKVRFVEQLVSYAPMAV